MRDMHPLALLARYVAPYWGRVCIAAACLLSANAATLVGPVILKHLVDRLEPTGLAAHAWVWPWVMLVPAYGLARLSVALITEFRELVFVPVTQGVIQRVKMDVHRSLLERPLQYHWERQTGALAQGLAKGVGALQALVSHTLYAVAPTALELAFGIGLLGWQYPWPIAATVLGATIAFLALTRPLTTVLATQRARINELDAQAHQISFEMLMNVELVQSRAGLPRELARLQEVLDQHRREIIRSARWSTLLNLGQQFIMVGCATGVLALCVSYQRAGILSVGDLVLILTLVIQAFTPLSALGGVYQEVRHALVDFRSVVPLLAEGALSASLGPPASPSTIACSAPAIHLHEVSVNFGPSGGLHEVDLEIAAGQWVAIVGPSGSGKTTLTRVLMRQIAPSGGEVRFDTQSIRDIPESQWTSMAGILPAVVPLFADTLAANITYPQKAEAIPAPVLAQVIERAGLDAWVASLPLALASPIGELGGKLSAGERQRVGFARLLLQEPALMILDEPTSALDPRADRDLMAELARLRGRHTIVVVAHRLASVVGADQIIVMEAGRVLGQGTHHDLILRCPLYARMWEAQTREMS